MTLPQYLGEVDKNIRIEERGNTDKESHLCKAVGICQCNHGNTHASSMEDIQHFHGMIEEFLQYLHVHDDSCGDLGEDVRHGQDGDEVCPLLQGKVSLLCHLRYLRQLQLQIGHADAVHNCNKQEVGLFQ